jgi:type IV secretory pathway TraG/TraD family ATPase VirD4
MVVFGTTGAGKTTWALRNIVRSPGPAIVSSMKPELFAYSAGWFISQGRPVWVFDAEGTLDPDPEMQMRWSPITSCVVPERPPRLPSTSQVAKSNFGGYVLVDLAQKMAERLSYGATTNPDWRPATAGAIAPMLVAAAIGGVRDVKKLISWTEGPSSALQALDLLRMAGLPELRSRLNTAFGPASATGGANRQSYANLFSDALRGFTNPYVAQMCLAGPQEAFDVRRFVAERGVLYLVGSSESQEVIASVIATMVEDIVERARQIQKPLRPPLCLWLDEVANTAPLSSLPRLFSTGRGDGLYISVVLQSYSQAADRWGQGGAATIQANATVELHLAGSKDQSMLNWLEHAGGRREVVNRSVSYGADRSRSDSAAWAKEAAYDARELRSLPPRHAWLLYRNQDPAKAHLAPWWECSEREAIELSWKMASRWVPPELMPLPAPPRRNRFALAGGHLAPRGRQLEWS